MSTETKKHKVQVAAKLHEDCRYYRRAGLVLSSDQTEHHVTDEQLLQLRSDPSVVVVGGPEVVTIAPLPKPAAPQKDLDEATRAQAQLHAEANAKIQELGSALTEATARAKAAEDKGSVLEARLLKLEQQLGDGGKKK